MPQKSYFLNDKEMQNIQDHYRRYFTEAGAMDSGGVLHEVVSDGLHIDLVPYNPTDEFPYYIFATMGMSAYRMRQAPFKNIELIMFLPADWKTTKEYFSDGKWYWPIRMLKSAARLPFLTKGFLSMGHTFSMDEDNTPFDSSTDMCSGLVTFPSWLPTGVFELRYSGLFTKKKVNFLCLTAINEKELTQIRNEGVQKFLDTVLVKDGKDDLLVRDKR